ncbi:MAG TPA: PQQ-dependent sugar dehydrogenase, partial [Anaerolineales bacterium]|nr:PQQ-dependent sugar dehydrogenase [Anaerolineales bacterium]
MKKLILLFIVTVAACNGVDTPTQTPAALTPTVVSTTQTPSIPSTITVTETTAPIPATETPGNTSTFPDPNAYTWQPLDIPSLQRPVDLQADGSGRLFVIEKVGRIRIIENGQMLETSFLDITDRVGSNGNEQGLLGMAFHPQYADNGRFFVNYTDSRGDTVIARFQVTSDPN